MSVREELLSAIFIHIRYDFADKHILRLQKKLMLRLCKRILKEDCNSLEEVLFYKDLIKQIKKFKLDDGRYFREYCDLNKAKTEFDKGENNEI